jgi:hypothetical protein
MFVHIVVASELWPFFNLISSHNLELRCLKVNVMCVYVFKLQEKVEGSSFDGEVLSWLNKKNGLSKMKVVHNKPLNTISQDPSYTQFN